MTSYVAASYYGGLVSSHTGEKGVLIMLCGYPISPAVITLESKDVIDRDARQLNVSS